MSAAPLLSRSLQLAQHRIQLHRRSVQQSRSRGGGSVPCCAQRQRRDPQQRQPRADGRTVFEPEVLPRESGERQQRGREGWDWPPPPPPPPPPPRKRLKVGQLMGSRRELLASAAFIGVVVLGFQAVDPLRNRSADDESEGYGERGMPSVQYTAEGVIVRRPTTGSPLKVVGGNEPGLLLLMDLQTRDLFEMRLGLETQVDPYQRDLINHIFLNPGWELMLKRVPLRN